MIIKKNNFIQIFNIIKIPHFMSKSPSILKYIPQLTISPSGKFKYILIQCQTNGQPLCNIIRGDKELAYHQQNFEKFSQQLKNLGFINTQLNDNTIITNKNGMEYKFVCPGGGRLQHHYQGNKCLIYGYSVSYGQADHTIAQKIISQHLGYPIEEIKLGGKSY